MRHGIWLIVGLLALGASGCAYRLGPVNGLAAGSKSVQIVPFNNQTLQPRLTDAVTAQLHKQVQRDGTYRLATHGDGDIVVSGTIIRYARQEISLSSSDVQTAVDYQIEAVAQVTARERSTGKIILDKPISGTTLIRVTSDLTSTERQALPLLAADLARNVIDLLAEGSW
jgi:hypothetical protein